MLPPILHSHPIWLPQTETWLYAQILDLQNLGIGVYVVCERTENLGQFAVRNIHSLADAGLVRSAWERSVRILGVRRHLKFLVDVGRSVGARVVHSHFGHVGWRDLAAARKLSAKHLVTFYGFDVNMLPSWSAAWRRRYRELFARVDRVLCEGPYMAQCISRLGCDPEKITVQHLGIAVDNIAYRPRTWNAKRPLRVLIAASFREKKGIPYALEALAAVNRHHPVELTVIGDANQERKSQEEKERILKVLDNCGMGGCTRLLGYQSHEVLLREAYNHDLFLQPSVTASDGDTEGGAPVAIIEMLATGMPVVATQHCDIPHVLGPALTDFLAPERDSAALAAIIERHMSQVDAWATLAMQARERIALEYDRPTQARRLVSHYKSLVE